MKVCKTCGEENTNDSLFCCNCGSAAFVFKEEVACPKCGASNVVTNEYCTECGCPLSSDATTGNDVATPRSDKFEVIMPDQPTQTAVTDNTDYTVIPSPETSKCPKCGAEVPITAIYCNHCGTNVTAQNIHKVVKRRLCPYCGKPNPMGSAYCGHCFGSLTGADITDMQVEYDTMPVGDYVVQQAVLCDLNGKNIVCPNCGTLNAADEDFCVNCGLKLAIEDSKKYCPNCGAENPSDSSFCSNCQWSFSGEQPDQIDKWKCPHCGNLNDRQDKFCTNCGTVQDSEVKHE